MDTSKRIFELDALRGMAALGVCIFHFYSAFKYRYTGVDLFFIISGFVIYMSVVNTVTIKNFLFARFMRLFPVYWLSIIIAITINYFFSDISLPHRWNYIVGNLTMLQPIFRCSDWVEVYWTLAIEINFYVLICVLWQFKLLKQIETALLILMLTIAALNLAYNLPESHVQITRIFIMSRGVAPIISHFHLFAAGIIFYLIYTSGFNTMRVFLLLLSFAMIALTHYTGGNAYKWLTVNEHLFCSFLFYTIFTLLALRKLSGFQNKILVIMGNISYPFYLIHVCFYLMAIYFIPVLGRELSKSLGIAFSLITAYLITYHFDVPLRAWIKSKRVLKIDQPIAIIKS